MIEHYVTGKPGKRPPCHPLRKMAANLVLAGLMMVTCAEISASPRMNRGQNLEFKGTLVEPPPCSLNGGNTVYVNFGEKLSIRKVENGVYRQHLDLDMACEESSQAWQMTLFFTGEPATFDADNATVVSAQQANLGVKLFASNQPLKMNTPVRLNGNELPQLEAVLVQKADSELHEGEFSAKATLRVAYE